MRHYLIGGTLCLAVSTAANAADINGTVRDATDQYATVATDSDLFPVSDDKAVIFFTMPGSTVEISVAEGHVLEINGTSIRVKIDNATGTVRKDQLVRFDSPNPRKRPAAAATGVISFDQLAPGPIPNGAFADRGLQLKGTKGDPEIHQAGPSMVMPPTSRNVLLLAGEPVTSLTIAFQNPVKRFTLVRIGTTGGASIPTWTMTAYDSNGNAIGRAGEQHGIPAAPQPFAIEGKGIVRVEINTDNRYGAGTWATWNSLPIATFSFDR